MTTFVAKHGGRLPRKFRLHTDVIQKIIEDNSCRSIVGIRRAICTSHQSPDFDLQCNVRIRVRKRTILLLKGLKDG